MLHVQRLDQMSYFVRLDQMGLDKVGMHHQILNSNFRMFGWCWQQTCVQNNILGKGIVLWVWIMNHMSAVILTIAQQSTLWFMRETFFISSHWFRTSKISRVLKYVQFEKRQCECVKSIVFKSVTNSPKIIKWELATANHFSKCDKTHVL